MFIVILPLGIMLSYSSQCLLVRVIFNFFVLFLVDLLLGDKQEFKFGGVMSILYTHFIPMF